MNWFKTHKLSNAFYSLVAANNNRIAMSPAGNYKKTDLKRWLQIHKMLAEAVGIDKSDPDFVNSFVELSDVFRELTDRLGHLPSRESFLTAWDSWQRYKALREHPEEEEVFDYFGGGQTRVPPASPIPQFDPDD